MNSFLVGISAIFFQLVCVLVNVAMLVWEISTHSPAWEMIVSGAGVLVCMFFMVLTLVDIWRDAT